MYKVSDMRAKIWRKFSSKFLHACVGEQYLNNKTSTHKQKLVQKLAQVWCCSVTCLKAGSRCIAWARICASSLISVFNYVLKSNMKTSTCNCITHRAKIMNGYESHYLGSLFNL